MPVRWVEEYRGEVRRLRRLAEAARTPEDERKYLAAADNYERMALAAETHEERLRLGPDTPTAPHTRKPTAVAGLSPVGLAALKTLRR